MNVVIERLKEPSTWLGFGALAALFGLNDTEWASLSQALAGIFAILGIILKEASASGRAQIENVKKLKEEESITAMQIMIDRIAELEAKVGREGD